jgi:hypothetical protein
MATISEQKTSDVDQIVEVLGREFSGASVYRYNPASLRVRVLDERFRGRTIPEREQLVRPLLSRLPREIQAEITILLLIAPDEASSSLMNLEFENPSPSML